ncbi:MAG: hypothetical protein Q9215_002687 [Flavoplaca cf. flavocitrina]
MRSTRLGFPLAKRIISGIYIHALWRLLGWKPTVRQRCVFLDLIYVNVITILFKILSTLLVYLNQTGTSHSIQVFSYSLKSRLKFIVVNQQMAIAAPGFRLLTFGEKRYHLSSGRNNSYHHQGITPDEPKIDGFRQYEGRTMSKGNGEISIPESVFEKVHSRSMYDQSSKDDLSLQSRQSNAPGEDAAPATSGTGFQHKALAKAMRLGSSSAGDGVAKEREFRGVK